MKRQHTKKQLDGDLANTFKAARWEGSDGEPVCPRCFDGESLHQVSQPTRTVPWPGLPVFHCRCCHRYLSTTYDTPLERSNVPLVYWAYFVMAGPEHEHNLKSLSGAWGLTRPTLYRMQARLAESSTFVDRWRRALERSDISLEQLYQRAVQEKSK